MEINQEYFKKLFPDLPVSDFVFEPESKEYSAARFSVGEKHVVFRKAKVTPRKVGQFVTIWKRNADGVTAPFDETDDIDFLVIATGEIGKTGYYVFPRAVLAERGIITTAAREGKRGTRIYFPSDIAVNKQAQKTQNWQKEYFADSDESLKNLILKTLTE